MSRFTRSELDPIGPFLKWAGGKSQLLQQFQALLPADLSGRGYVEPFLGSGAVFFHVAQTRHPARCCLLDSNPGLVNLFVQIRDHLPELLPLLLAHRERHNAPGEAKDYFYSVRAREPEPIGLESAARFLYLNKTCFNGLHRVNSKGRFNVPIGSYQNPQIFDAAQLVAASGLLQGVRIETADYRELERFVEPGDFVYADPPYEPISRTSFFTAYARDAFKSDDQVALRDLLLRLSGRCDWMLSNSTAPLIEDLYEGPGFFKHRLLATRSINSKAEGRGQIAELVVTSYPVGG